MGRGTSKAGGSEFSQQAAQNVKGMSGYSITTASGEKREFFFRKSGGDTFYSNSIGGDPEPTPNNWTESQMIERIENNGGTAEKYSKKELVEKETKRLEDRAEFDKFLNNEYARNRHADSEHKAYRNYRKASRMARR